MKFICRKAELRLIPMFLGGVMNTTGNKPPATVPAKAAFLVGDLQRNALLFNRASLLDSPSNFFTEVASQIRNIQRYIIAVQSITPKLDETKVRNVIWELSKGIHEDTGFRNQEDNSLKIDEEFIKICSQRAGLDAETISKAMKLSGSKEAKDTLKSNTDEACEKGAFGSPTMIIYPDANAPVKEPFMTFGSDRFEQIAFACGLPYPGMKALAKL